MVSDQLSLLGRGGRRHLSKKWDSGSVCSVWWLLEALDRRPAGGSLGAILSSRWLTPKRDLLSFIFIGGT